MDTEYILMCKEATEIQEQWEPQIGDVIAPGDSGKLIIGVREEENTILLQEWGDKNYWVTAYDVGDPVVWLPRQEDLQQIFKEEKQVSEDITLLLFKRYIADLGSVCTQCEGMSITKAWLCCIMEKLYAKDWDSESKTWVSL